jgi:hypothetical protein
MRDELSPVHWAVLDELGKKLTNESGYNPVVIDGFGSREIDLAIQFLERKGLINAAFTGQGLGTTSEWNASSLTNAGRLLLDSRFRP